MTIVATKRSLAKVGDQLFYNLTDRNRSGFDKSHRRGIVTKVSRVYLTIDDVSQFNIENGNSRGKGDYTMPGSCWGSDELMVFLIRDQLAKLGRRVEYCEDLAKVRAIATIIGLDLTFPDLPA